MSIYHRFAFKVCLKRTVLS